MQGVRILIVEDHHSLRSVQKELLAAQPGIVCVEEAANGAEALNALEAQPFDIVITELVMPVMDGFTLMEEMHKRALKPMPKVIVASALSGTELVRRALAQGAGFYLLKPFRPENLIGHIRELMGEGARYAAVQRENSHLDEQLGALLLSIGIPGHIKGYRYLRAGVKLVLENAECINHITKKLYPGIAAQFATSPSRVDRAIRHAIDVAWNRGRPETLNQLFGCRVCTERDKPSNGEFIAMVAEHMNVAS